MFAYQEVFSSFSVNDLDKAKAFYRDLLGLRVVVQEYLLELQVAGTGGILVYPKPDHEPATFTVLNFKVTDMEQSVRQLKAEGVRFEAYDLPGLKTDDHHICTMAAMDIRQAWFKDPAGNILSVISGPE